MLSIDGKACWEKELEWRTMADGFTQPEFIPCSSIPSLTPKPGRAVSNSQFKLFYALKWLSLMSDVGINSEIGLIKEVRHGRSGYLLDNLPLN